MVFAIPLVRGNKEKTFVEERCFKLKLLNIVGRVRIVKGVGYIVLGLFS